MRDCNFEFCADLEKLIQDEAAARKEYYRFLEAYGWELTFEQIEKIKEIIEEELKHTEILSEMVFKNSKISPEA